MYEFNSSNQDQLWLNIGLAILIAGLFVTGLYYYQDKQLTQLESRVENLKTQLASLIKSNDPQLPKLTSPNKQETTQGEVITSGTRELSRIALTFDADMTVSMREENAQWYDPDIIKTLKEQQVPATFFLTGMWARTYPEVTEELAENDLFKIGNHAYQTMSFSQPCYELTPLKTKQSKVESIRRTQQIIKDITGQEPTYFRFPGGCYQKEDLKLVNDQGLKVVQWDVISGDAFANSTSFVVDKTLESIRNGSIIVFHLGGPNAPKTNQALKQIIPELKQRGFRFDTIHSLLNPPTVKISS